MILHEELIHSGSYGGNLSVVSQENFVLSTAEFYRLASQIYFQRAVRRKPQGSAEVWTLVQNALKLLENLQACSAPWPISIIACEVEDYFERTCILDILDSSEKITRAGNLVWLRNMVQTVWK